MMIYNLFIIILEISNDDFTFVKYLEKQFIYRNIFIYLNAKV
jgi:hypothetical protein